MVQESMTMLDSHMIDANSQPQPTESAMAMENPVAVGSLGG